MSHPVISKIKPLLFHPFFFFSLLFMTFLPCIWSVFYIVSKLKKIEALSEKIAYLEDKASFFEKEQKREEKILLKLKNADPQYLEKYVESLVFLEPELQRVQSLLEDNDSDEGLKTRLEFLRDRNRLTFAEKEIKKNDLFQETEEIQKNPIEINEQDLKKLLCNIETIPIPPFYPLENHPNLVIHSFELTKKTDPFSKEKVFSLKMNLLKREAIYE